MRIQPIILCGGSGTRLWPLSRKSYPKQFSKLIGSESLFQRTARRLTGEGFSAPVVITSADFRFIVVEQLQDVGVTPAAVLIEPDPRNTAPAVLAAALWVAQKTPDAMLLLAPSDHLIPDSEGFRSAVLAAARRADTGRVVTFGITPTRPETGFGYLELADARAVDKGSPQALKRFIEKPDARRATEMLASGRYLWNAGIFLFRTDAIVGAYRKFAPGLLDPVGAAVAGAAPDLDFIRLDPGPWSQAETISVDYAIMEKSDDLWVMPYHGTWSDLGDWDAVWSETGPDEAGVSTHGEVTAIDCNNSLLRSEHDAVELVAIGVHDLIAVAMPDAVLLADKSRSQDVKLAVSALKTKGAHQAESFPRNLRPWGWFESLVRRPGFQVKRIVVKPGAALSLQSHRHRSEHWVVVEGVADVTLDDAVHRLTPNQSIYIPLGARHRLANPGPASLTVIEVQTGDYLGEDDIVRYDDVYARP